MRPNAQEFVTFLASHFRPIEAMCRERVRFQRDDEIAAFLHRFEDDDKNVTRLIGRMREVGVLRELAGLWSPPPFLANFLENLEARSALASPQVIQGWIEAIRELVTQLSTSIADVAIEADPEVTEQLQYLMQQIADVFQSVQRTVEENCERIATEVAEYRSLEDEHHLRARLSRLVSIQRNYLDPVIRILDVNGELHDVTSQVSSCCIRLEARLSHTGSSIAEEAVMLRREVVWLERVTILRAEEARRELGPLCEAAARESKISVGVNRAIERIARRDWAWLNLEDSMPILDEHDGTLFSDLAIENYLDEVMHAIPAQPPTVPHDPPDHLPSPVTAANLIERLQDSDPIDDLMAWVLEADSELRIGSSLRLFDEISRTCCEANPTEELRQYERDQLSLSAVRWVWNSNADTSEVSL